MTKTALGIKALTFTYEGSDTPSLCELSLSIAPGECVLLTGPSGCGKSTLLHAINGLIPSHHPGKLTGSIDMAGEAIAGRPLWALADRVGTVFQNPDTQFFQSNVEDELAFGLEHRRLDRETIRDRLKQVTTSFKLDTILQRDLFSLSSGEKQRIAIAAITALEQPLLLFDEPTANLDPDHVRLVLAMLHELKRAGRTLFIAEHRIAHVLSLADRVVVMNQGAVIHDGSPDMLDDPEFRSTVGLRVATLDQVTPSKTSAPETSSSALSASNLSWGPDRKRRLISDLNFTLFAGECLGVIGPNGAGKSTMARVLAGLERRETGLVKMKGEVLKPKKRLGHIAYVSQHADQQLFAETVRDEIALAAIDTTRKIKVDEILERFDLARLSERHPHSLSGGEKQRTAIAASVARGPTVLILDEPTSGMDGFHLRQMATEIRRLCQEGVAVVVITHDYELIALVCDRLIRLEKGQVARERSRNDITDERSWFSA